MSLKTTSETALVPEGRKLRLAVLGASGSIGTQTLETRIIMARTVCDNVIGFLEGDRPVARVLHP